MLLQRWLELAPGRVAFQGLPARICWLGYGDRARAGLAINELVRSGAVSAPVVIGRDHLDAGSVASPYRETEAMRDGSDAIADWPILNALVNVAAGATWVSVHHGGGVGIGNSIHAGMVVVADGTADAAERLERVLTTDPGHGRRPARRRGLRGGARRRRRARARPAVDPRRRDVEPRCSSATSRRSRSPAGSGAPLRGAALREIEVTPRTRYVLCEDGRIAAAGRMRDLRPLGSDVEELDGRGLSAIPGLVDCHTHACFAGDRVEEFSLRAGGASYEELHAARRRHPLDGSSNACRRRGRSRGRARRARWLDASCGDDDVRGEVRVRARPRDGARAAPRDTRGRGRSHMARRAHGSARVRRDGGDAYIDFLLDEVLPEAAGIAEAADVFLERGAFDAEQARRYLSACADAGLALRLHGDQFTESGAIPLAIELGARSVDHLEATGSAGIAALAASDVTGVLLPASALFLNRPMPPARALVDAGAAVALATDFNPGSAFCESLPLVCSLAATQMSLAPEEALSACTVNAAHVLGRAERKGRLAPGYDADLVLVAAEDWRHVAYHLGGRVVDTVIATGKVAWSSRA